MTAAEPALLPDAAGLASPEWGGFDMARTGGRGWVDIRRSFGTAVRLGWQMEANWTDPLLFFIYSVAKPLASALILVVMLDVISGGARPEYRAFVVVGSALWSFVLSGVSGLAWMILDDRERYREGGFHILQRFSVDDFETCPPRFMPPKNLVKAGFERGNVQISGEMNCYRLVVERDIGNQLRMQPDLLLRIR